MNKVRLADALKSDWIILIILIAFLTAFFSYLSYLRFLDFFTANWDLGINEQMLWTQTHGYLLFETGDYVHGGPLSFLQIHSAYVSLPIAYLYLAFPTPITLFIIQAAAISGSIVPFYLIARKSGLSRNLSYLSSIVYILNFAIIAALLYDFHWESMIPIEFLSMFYLIQQKKFLLSLVPFAIGCCTLEVFPFLTAGAVLYFAYDWYSIGFLSLKKRLHDRTWQFLLMLLILAVLSYLAIRTMQNDVVPSILGIPSGGESAVTQSVASLFILNLSWAAFSVTLLYWALLYISFAFIPFFYPKHLLLSIPWMVATFLLYPNFSTGFGNQYAFIAISPIAIAFVFGLNRLERRHVGVNARTVAFGVLSTIVFFAVLACFDSRLLLSQEISELHGLVSIFVLLAVLMIVVSMRIDGIQWQPVILQRSLRFLKPIYKEVSRYSILLIVLASVVFSIALSPLNQNNFAATNQPGYAFKLKTNPAFPYAQIMAGYIPTKTSILASNNLFPLVANNPDAYSLPWYAFNSTAWPHFPFSPQHLPEFVFLNSMSMGNMPAFLKPIIFNASDYGLRAFTYFTGYPGSLYLFQLHYAGATALFKAVKTPSVYYFTASNLSMGASGRIVNDPSSKFGKVIASDPAANLSGNGHCIWYGPYLAFMPGKYQVTISVKGGSYSAYSGKSVPVLYMNSNSYGTAYYYSTTINSTRLSNNTWTNFTYSISMLEPYPNTEFRGYIQFIGNSAYGYVYLNYIAVHYLGPL